MLTLDTGNSVIGYLRRGDRKTTYNKVYEMWMGFRVICGLIFKFQLVTWDSKQFLKPSHVLQTNDLRVLQLI